uniref:Pentatricopeptide repeat-containing protein At2g13420, mitochondrial-like n=1 Tax=Nicotiana sylvestris TaxID=4096 RepID=A0A1U7WDK4_NICSY|nr:PREDICTED: pentatricopeptide repeat-containing protein At2g13420, mitochondrial-like [Nicotiana sylvestris]
MRRVGLAPNEFTYTSLIDAHFKAGKVDKALKLVKEMLEMVRTLATGCAGRPPIPPTEATRGRGCGCGRGREAGAAPVDPLVAPAQDQALAAPVQAPAVPIVIPGLQETLAQILTVCTGLAQVMQGLQTLEAPPAQPVVPVQGYRVPVMLDDEQCCLESFSRFQPPSFSGILESSGMAFTTFQFTGAAFTWWEAYERRKPAGAAPLTWQEFSTLFLEKWIPQSQREELQTGYVAKSLFTQIKDIGIDPDIITYNSLIDGIGEHGELDDMVYLYEEMKKVGCFPDVITYNTLINYFFQSGRMVLAFKNLHEMKKSGLNPNVVTYNTFIDVFAKKGCYKKLSNSLLT